jgi:hypothetical protein
MRGGDYTRPVGSGSAGLGNSSACRLFFGMRSFQPRTIEDSVYVASGCRPTPRRAHPCADLDEPDTMGAVQPHAESGE